MNELRSDTERAVGTCARVYIFRLRERRAQRLALRADYLASVEGSHPDFAETLGIDAAAKQKFFELLADQHLQRLAEFGGAGASTQAGGAGLAARCRR